MDDSSAKDSTIYRSKYGETPKLTHDNYHQWHQAMEPFLQAVGAYDIVVGDEDPPAGARALAEYNMRVGKVRSMIHAACSPGVRVYLAGIKDPRVMWETLKEKVDTTASRTGQTALVKQFYKLKPDSSGISNYVTKPLELRTELADTERVINDEAFTTHLLASLPDSFNSIVDIIHNKSEDQTVDQIITTLIKWEKAQKARKEEVRSNTNISSTMTSANALIGQSRNHSSDHTNSVTANAAYAPNAAPDRVHKR